ncbi:putative monovalent cation/H+ antiporter subunit A [Methylobrevis albus]|uniref:Monovalent cation/H+ antiporter subunit A n=1 Tax=Methylobrevis albus TaxID=2793297 RepID=A0A931MYV0_9HYPH|nr:putative monovalent cation/H+ antiporter subunit A [Methylobrevis albus]MBH0237101.1 putative monovalent cation/H+ antiporter subunit A [Methylobrevis albus]
MTSETHDWIFLAAAAPFLAALVAPVLHRLLGARAGWVLALVPFAIFLQFASLVPLVAAGGTATAAADWLPAYGVRLSYFIDGLSLVFALLISGIGTLIVVYAGGYLAGHPQLGRFFSFILMFMGAMLGLVIADNLIALFIYWELTSITSFLLIGFDHSRAASRRAALQALLVTGGGGLALMAGVLLIASVTGTKEMSEVLASGDVLRNSLLYVPILLLVLGGAFTKSAQFPFHFWLPNAMEAPTPVSAYLHSATMVKAGVYLLMRLQPVLGDTVLWMTILPLFGAVTLLVGTLLAVRQTDLKLMLAYTTVASLGLLVLLTGTSSEKAIEGAVLYLFAHSLFKGALFMVAGIIDHEAGTRDVTKLGGLRKLMPITFAAALVGAISMAGLPVMIGFVAKEVLYEGLLGSSIWLLAAAVAGNALMLVIGFAVALKPFLGPEVHTPKHAHEGPPALWLGPVVLGLVGLASALAVGTTGSLLLGPMAAAVFGGPVESDLHLIPTYISAPLLLSILTVILGVGAFLALDRLRDLVARALKVIGWGPDRGFDQVVSVIVRFSAVLTRSIQGGRLEVYMTVTLALVALTLLLPMGLTGTWPAMPAMPEPTFYEAGVILIALLGLAAVVAARTRLTAIVSLGIQGFAVALIFMLFGAPDLSFTQFMVETLSVVILTLAMTRLNLAERDHRPSSQRLLDGTIAITCGAGFGLILLAVTQQAFDRRLTDFFDAYSRTIAHGRNVVNVIIVDFRGLDTLGEIAVVMITGLAILAVVRLSGRRRVPVVPEPEQVVASRHSRGAETVR